MGLFGKQHVDAVVIDESLYMEIDVLFIEIVLALVFAWGICVLLELDLIRRCLTPATSKQGDAVSVTSGEASTVEARSVPMTAGPSGGGWFSSLQQTFSPQYSTRSVFPSTTTVVSKINSTFPQALANKELVSKVSTALVKYGYGETTLLATSLCCDEVNRDLEKDFEKVYGQNFSMGGLAGFAFGGVTSFGAMAHHIPSHGSCLIVFGPHVGVDSTGAVGKINRRGRAKSGACCGSAAAAAGYVTCVRVGSTEASAAPSEPLDAQQTFVGNLLLPYAERLEKASDPDVELPFALFDAQNELMQKIVAAGCGEVHGEGKIALLGGIQINTPPGTTDYFLPLTFEVRSNSGDLLETIEL